MRLSSTSSSNRGRAFGFVLRGLVFLLPVALFVGIFEVIFWRSGDAWPIDWVVREQLRDPRVLYGRGYFSQQFNVYKLAMWRALSPDTEVDTAASASTVDKSWWNDFHEKVPAGMRSVGIPCHAVRSPLVHGLSDEYMLDGFHPSEGLSFNSHGVEGLPLSRPLQPKSILPRAPRPSRVGGRLP